MIVRRWKLVLALVLLPLLAYVVYRGAHRGSDFKYPYRAAQLLWQTGALHVRAQPRYPITLHVILAPLASLPLGVAAGLWAGLSVAAMAMLPGWLGRLSGVEPRRQVVAWALVAPFFVDALILGQADPINLGLVTAGLLAAKEGRGAGGAGLIGLAGLIKFLPFAHWGTLISRRRSPDVWIGMALTTACGFGLLVAAVGWAPALAGLRAQAEWIGHHEQPWQLVARSDEIRANNESLPVVLARTFGDIPPEVRDGRTIALARLPLKLIWPIWWGIIAALGIGWLAAFKTTRRMESGRAWLGMFALTSIGTLAATPVCWNHYFLWTLPAALFLVHRPRLLLAAAVASLLGSASQSARGLGCHMLLALGLFALVVHDLLRQASPRENPATRECQEAQRTLH
jgi:alpha-1,2-mannosyltransferase